MLLGATVDGAASNAGHGHGAVPRGTPLLWHRQTGRSLLAPHRLRTTTKLSNAALSGGAFQPPRRFALWVGQRTSASRRQSPCRPCCCEAIRAISPTAWMLTLAVTTTSCLHLYTELPPTAPGTHRSSAQPMVQQLDATAACSCDSLTKEGSTEQPGGAP